MNCLLCGIILQGAGPPPPFCAEGPACVLAQLYIESTQPEILPVASYPLWAGTVVLWYAPGSLHQLSNKAGYSPEN